MTLPIRSHSRCTASQEVSVINLSPLSELSPFQVMSGKNPPIFKFQIWTQGKFAIS